MVAIDVGRKGEQSFIRIADNGTGMTDKVIDEAMRYGSRRPYDPQDLGKFGLGLKTASLSQCRRLTVASRTTPAGRIRIRRWDLDNVRSRDAWELERLVPSECPRYLVEPLREVPGTVVLWEKLDRILAYDDPTWRSRRQSPRDDERCDRRTPRDGVSPVPFRRDRRPAASEDPFQRGSVEALGSVCARRTCDAGAVGTASPRRACRENARSEGAPVRSPEPGSVHDSRGTYRSCGTEEVEPAAGLLHLSRRPHDPEWWMEPAAHDGRTQQARTHRTRHPSRSRGSVPDQCREDACRSPRGGAAPAEGALFRSRERCAGGVSPTTSPCRDGGRRRRRSSRRGRGMVARRCLARGGGDRYPRVARAP